MKFKKATIILSNRESQAAGHHALADCDDQAAEVFRREIRATAHDRAKRISTHVEVFATRRNCQPWLVYSTEK